jgi:hypothetical protein
LRDVIAREPGAAASEELIARWLAGGLSTEALTAAARGSGGEPWETRRIAALMLEHELRRSDDAELPARAERNARVHDGIRGLRTTPRALATFLRLARRECRLLLGRTLFTPEEVAHRIEQQLRVVPAVRDAMSEAPPPYASEDAPRTVAALPEFERTLLRLLGEPPRSYWVGDDTPSEINSLVEYPLGTVALAIKPPGSDLEFEIKRAGLRGPSVLGAACIPHQYTRSHYMRGASTKTTLVWEADVAAWVNRAWQSIHGDDAPLSQAIYIATVMMVPSEHGPVNVIRYFVDPSFHNGNFGELRRSIRTAVTEELLREGGYRRPPEHDAALTGAFVGLINPGQAILTNTSSFRLDVVARYLAPDGARCYFSREVPLDEAFAFADEMLDEILGVYTPPRTRARTYGGYVEAALAANRARAGEVYRDLLAQIGRFWGTLSALRVGSNGESFVPRNVGLRSRWEDGRWRVRILFMDHDGMAVPGLHERDFQPASQARMMMNDYRFIFGGTIPGTKVVGELEPLAAIYRPSPALQRNARALVRASARAAYDHAMHALENDPGLRRQYGERFITRHRDWDVAVSTYLAAKREGRDAWETATRARLHARGYGQQHIDGYVKTIRGFDVLPRRTGFLYR